MEEDRRRTAVVQEGAWILGSEFKGQALTRGDASKSRLPIRAGGMEVNRVGHGAAICECDLDQVSDPNVQDRSRHTAIERPGLHANDVGDRDGSVSSDEMKGNDVTWMQRGQGRANASLLGITPCFSLETKRPSQRETQ
jgi:hypothetical protein